MAINFLNSISLNQNELIKGRIENQPNNTAAGTGVEGQLYYDTTLDVLKVWANGAWAEVGGGVVSLATANSTFVNLANSGTASDPILTASLNATGTPSSSVYLRGDNAWEPISAIPGTYAWTVQADPTSPTTNPTNVPSGSNVLVLGGGDMETTLNGLAFTVDLKVGPGDVGTNDNYVSNQAAVQAGADDSIPFNLYSPGLTPPSTQVNVVKKTTFGTIPVAALTLVKQYIDDSVAGGLIYQGGYNASSNTPVLDSRGAQIAVKKGWTYTVTAAGTFYGEAVEVGDLLIAEVDLNSSNGTLADWTTVQNNIGIATAGTDANAVIGISRYDEDDFTVSASGFVELKASSYAATVTGTATVTHNLNTKDVIVQLYDIVTNDTVYADVARATVDTVTITFASTPTNSVRVLVQK